MRCCFSATEQLILVGPGECQAAEHSQNSSTVTNRTTTITSAPVSLLATHPITSAGQKAMSPHGFRQKKQATWCQLPVCLVSQDDTRQHTLWVVGNSVVGESTKQQPRSFIVLHRSLQLYPKGTSRSKSCAQLELGRWMRMRNSFEAVSHDIGIRSSPLVNSYQAYFLLLYEKLQDILPGLVRRQSSLAYMTYVERCKVTRILWQNCSTRTWLLPQTNFFYSQCLVNICMGHCKPDLSLTSDDASSSLSSSVCCRYSPPTPLSSLCTLLGSLTNSL